MSGASITMTIEGLRELEAQLVTLREEAPGIVARALRDPMKATLEEMKERVPHGGPYSSGALREALGLTAARRMNPARGISAADSLASVGIRVRKGIVKVKDGKRHNPRRYWHLVEFGTAKMAPQSYIRSTMDARSARMVEEMKEKAAAGIRRAVKRRVRRALGG